jgi:hypothetical protein
VRLRGEIWKETQTRENIGEQPGEPGPHYATGPVFFATYLNQLSQTPVIKKLIASALLHAFPVLVWGVDSYNESA